MSIGATALEPVVDSTRMKDVLRETVDKRGKIARMIASGELIQLRRGLYATRRGLNPVALAGPIYGPSYIIFESALSFHGLIPEAVYEITSATLRLPKAVKNDFGRFRYRRTLKYDEVYLNDYESPAQARGCIGSFIEMYNGQRPHASLNGITPNLAYNSSGAQAAA